MNDECASTRFYHLDMQDVAYTCENAQHFFLHHVQYRWEDFHRKLKIAGKKGENIHKARSGAQCDLSDAYENCHKLDLSFSVCGSHLPKCSVRFATKLRQVLSWRVVACCPPSGPGQNRPSKQEAPSGRRRHRGGQSTPQFQPQQTGRECKYINI